MIQIIIHPLKTNLDPEKTSMLLAELPSPATGALFQHMHLVTTVGKGDWHIGYLRNDHFIGEILSPLSLCWEYSSVVERLPHIIRPWFHASQLKRK